MSDTKNKSNTALEQELVAKALTDLLTGAKPKLKTDVAETEFNKTKKIIIPETMDKLEASQELKRQWDEEETVVNVTRELEGWEYKDVLAAVKRASEKHFGWINGVTTPGFFGVTRPRYIEIVTNVVNGKQITEECFFGDMEIAAWEFAKMSVNIRSSSHVQLNFQTKKKYKQSIMEFYSVILRELKENSIYKSKSVAISRSNYGGVEYEIFENKPSNRIFFNDAQQSVIDDFVLPDILEEGKRCYLFTGDYGTGKTEQAMIIGKEANLHKMTFIYLKDASLLNEVILLCQKYEPSLLFLEDIDEVTSGDRDTDINTILNTLDGIQSKRSNLKIIFTTNHEEKINQAFRRPGRIDLIVKFHFPDKKTRIKIAQSWLNDLPGYKEINWEEACGFFPEAQGAVIAEICKRIRRLSIKNGSVENRYFKSASASIEPQVHLMKTKAVVQEVTLETLFSRKFKELEQNLMKQLENF